MTIGATTDDRELLEAYVHEGSELAFTELVRRHQAMMRATACRVCGDSQEALDAMQRALIAFARRAKEIRADAGVGPWLHRAVTLEAMSLRRQRIKRRTREHEAMERQQQTNEGMPPEIAAELDGAISKLPPKDRDAIVMHYFEGRTFRAIAGKLGGTEMAWQKRGVRALSKLSATLRRRGVVATTTALGTWMAATRAEAGVSAGALAPMMQEALRNPLATSIPLKSSPVLFLIMKMKLALTLIFAGGVALSYAWNEATVPSLTSTRAEAASTMLPPRPGRSFRETGRFSLKGITSAVRHLDSLEQPEPAAESQLRALMFSVPNDYLVAVRDILGGVEHIDRFQSVAAAFYARWAEIDPEAAWLAAAEDPSFAVSARRGVLLTWLNIDTDLALPRLLEDRQPSDLAVLEEFIDGKAQHAPRDAANLVDRLTEAWPEADQRLFPKVAKAWASADPEGAGEWVASYWDPQVRNQLLRQLAQQVSSGRGRQGIALADRIDEPKLRHEARINAARWWGISSGPFALSETSDPDINLTGGFPSDWGADEIRSISRGLMANAVKSYPELIAIAEGEKQRQAVYEGVINGASFSQPALVVDAVENVDPTFAATPAGKKTLSAFILRWSETDPAAVDAWLASQSANAKTQLMQDALKEHTSQ